MKIRLGDFGGRVAPTTPTQARMPATPGVSIPEGAFVSTDTSASTKVLNAASGLLAQERAEAEQVAKAAEAERKRAEALTRVTEGAKGIAAFDVDTRATVQQISTLLDEGGISRDEAPKELDRRLDTLRQQHLDALDPETRAKVADNEIRMRGAAHLQVTEAVTKHAKRSRAAAFTGIVDQLDRLAVTNPDEAIEKAFAIYSGEGARLFGEDQAQKGYLQARERFAATHFAAQLTAARNNPKALRDLQGRMEANADLDPDRKSALVARTMGMIETLDARGERARQSRLRTVERALGDAWGTVLKGYDLAPEQLDSYAKAARGTELEPQARSLVELNGVTSRFRNMAPAGREKYLNDMEARIREAPGKVEVGVLEHLRTIHDNLDRAAKADPISFAQQKRLAEVQPLDLTKIDTLGGQVAARLDIARGMRAAYGTPIRLLTAGEAESFSQSFRSGTPEQKSALLAQVRKAVPDPQGYTALLAQLAQDSPVTAVAGVVAARDRSVTLERRLFGPNVEQLPRDIAATMLEGEAAVNGTRDAKREDGRPASRGLFAPPEEPLKLAFAQATRGAFVSDPSGADRAFQAVRAYYTGDAIRSGDAFDKDRGVNTQRLERSIRAVVGEVHDYNGRGAVLLPWGMDESTFQDRVRTRYRSAVKAAGLPESYAGMLPAMGLQTMGDGRYLVRSGTTYLLGKDGKPVELDVGDRYMLDAKGRRAIDTVPK